MLVLLRIVELDLGRDASGAEAEEEVVGVGAPPLPQPGARTGAGGEHGGGVGNGLPPVRPLLDQRLLGVLLDPLLVLLVLLALLGVRLPAVLLVVEVVAEEHDRAHHGHDEVVPAPEHEDRDDGADERQQRHQPRQRPSLVVAGRVGQREVRLPLGGRSRGGRL